MREFTIMSKWLNLPPESIMACGSDLWVCKLLVGGPEPAMAMTVFTSEILMMKLSWWRHQMETFSALLAICAGNSPVTGEFPAQRPVTRNFDVFFDLRVNKRLSKQPWGWWFETPLRALWRRCNAALWHTIVVHPKNGCKRFAVSCVFVVKSIFFRITPLELSI